MSKKEILLLLQELLRNAYYAYTDEQDASGISTKYYVDQEQLLKNINDELEKL